MTSASPIRTSRYFSIGRSIYTPFTPVFGTAGSYCNRMRGRNLRFREIGGDSKTLVVAEGDDGIDAQGAQRAEHGSAHAAGEHRKNQRIAHGLGFDGGGRVGVQ